MAAPIATTVGVCSASKITCWSKDSAKNAVNCCLIATLAKIRILVKSVSKGFRGRMCSLETARLDLRLLRIDGRFYQIKIIYFL